MTISKTHAWSDAGRSNRRRRSLCQETQAQAPEPPDRRDAERRQQPRRREKKTKTESVFSSIVQL